jgi:hypothetical protein
VGGDKTSSPHVRGVTVPITYGIGNPIPWFTFDTSTVVFYDKTSYIPTVGTPFVRVPIVNDPEVTKIDTNFIPGPFIDINIDFDPIGDPAYVHLFPSPSFFQVDDMNIVKHNGKWIASVPVMYRYVTYRSWSSTDNSKNQTLTVYVDKITGFTKRFESVLFNRNDNPQDNFKPAVKLEFRTRDGKTSTSTVQMADCYVHKDKLLFELNNENVKMYNDSEELVSSYKTISKQLNEGSFTNVKICLLAAAAGTVFSFPPCPSGYAWSIFLQACTLTNTHGGMG